MSGATRITPSTQAPDIQGIQEPWAAGDITQLQIAQSLAQEGKRAQSRAELVKMREKLKGKPGEAQVNFLMAADDYEGALRQAVDQLRTERTRGPEPIAAPPAEPVPQQSAAWVGGGGPLIEGDAAHEYASANVAANDDAASNDMFAAYDAETQPDRGVAPDPADLKAPDIVPAAAARGATQGSATGQGAGRGIRDLITGKPHLPTFTGDPVHDTGVVLGDVAVGVAEAPKAILGGVRNGVNELAGSIDSAGAWLATQAMLAEGDQAGAAKLAARRNAGETVLENQLPTVGDPRSATGKLVEGVTQFVTGFVAGGKVLKAAGLGTSGYLGTLLKGAFSDAFAFDPARYRLANLIEENPALENPVTEFLASKPGDTEAEGRLKNVLESGAIGLGVQGLTNVFIAGLKGLRSANHLTPAPVSLAEVEAQSARQVREGTAPMGDPNAPMLTTREAPGAQAAQVAPAKAAASDGETLTLYQGSPHKYDGELSNAHIGTGEGTAMEGYGHYLAQERGVGQAYQAMLSKVERADGVKVSAGLKEELKSRAGDLDGVEAMLHDGLRAEMARPKPNAARLQSLKNDLAEIADIRRVGLKDTGAVYKLNVTAKPSEIIDLEANVPPAIAKQFNIEAGLTGRAFYQKLSKKLGGDKEASDALNAAGIKGLRYKDSFSRGKDGGTHNYVIFDAKNIKKVPLGPEDVAAIQGRKPSQTPLAQPPMGTVPLGQGTNGKDVFINFARIDTPEDVKALMQKTANLHAGEISEAQRGIQSQEATKQLADDMGMTVNDLLSRRRGPNGARQPFTAEEALAARRLYTASSEKLYELAERAAGPNAGEIDLFNLRQMMSKHLAIQNEVLGARTETARALASWRIEAGSGQAQMNAIKAMMETAGPDTSRMAKELMNLKATGATPAAVAKYVRQSAVGTIGQGIREVYVNGLLSGPLTHIVNTFGNTLTLGLSVAERAVARTISKHVTASDAVAEGEAGAMLHGIVEGQRDALRLAWKATGDLPTADHLGKIDTPRVAAIASTRNDAFGTAVNVLGATTRAPSLLMTVADKYFRAVNYRAQLHSYAQRTVTSEGLAGKAAAQRYRELIDNPPEQIKIDADEAALTNTFNNATGWFGKVLLETREKGGPLNPAWLVVPFVRTPVNIARYAFERTPLAPLVGQWREAFARGGADRDMALAKAATGTMVMGLAQAGAANGYITGALPSDSGEAQLWMREGRQPYSVKIGDNWYSYNRADPFGMIMGFAADIENTLARGEVSPKDVDEWQEVVAGGIAAIADTATDKTFLRGFSQFNDMLSDPDRYAPKQINSTITGFVPFTALASWATRLQDPTVKDARTPLDAIYSRIPGLADRIIPKRDLWGETRTDPAVGFNAFSPLRASEAAAYPIDIELDRLRVYPEGIGWKSTVDGIAVDFSSYPQALDEYRRLAGNGWKHPAWGLGLRDFLDQTVKGDGAMSPVYRMFTDGEQGGKAAFIRKAVQDYREGAARELLQDPKFKDFQRYYEEERALQREAKQKVSIN